MVHKYGVLPQAILGPLGESHAKRSLNSEKRGWELAPTNVFPNIATSDDRLMGQTQTQTQTRTSLRQHGPHAVAAHLCIW